MPFFHATWRENLPSIMSAGIVATVPTERNFDCEPGAYLSEEAWLALGFLVEAFMEKADPNSNPSEMIKRMAVIVVDDSRVDRSRLRADPNVDRQVGTWLYDGIIDVRGMPVLSVDDIVPPGTAPTP